MPRLLPLAPPVAPESVIRTSPARIKTSVPSACALAATRFNERVEGRLQIFCDLPGPGRNTGEDEGFILTVDGATGAWKGKGLPVALIPANPIVLLPATCVRFVANGLYAFYCSLRAQSMGHTSRFRPISS